MNTIAVTGEPRSGTSLMMNILKETGLDIVGEKYPNIKEDREENMITLNEHGFWEIPGFVSRGAKHAAKYEYLYGKTFKIICRAMIQTDLKFINNIDKIIFCLRNPREIMESQKNLFSNVAVATNNSWNDKNDKTEPMFDQYKNYIGRYVLLANRLNLWNKTLVVDYANMLSNPEKQIKKVCEFLGKEYRPELSNLVEKRLYRSSQIKQYDKKAEFLYKTIKTLNTKKVENQIKKYLIKEKIENITWLDDTEFETWVIAGESLYKSLVNNNKGVRDKLKESALLNSKPTQCPYYQEDKETYTIFRRYTNNLVRKKINCEKPQSVEYENGEHGISIFGKISREHCFSCWQNQKMKKYMKNTKNTEQK